jgi:hypothetical protein
VGTISHHIQTLDITINRDKSILDRTRVMVYLGFTIDSIRGIIRPTSATPPTTGTHYLPGIALGPATYDRTCLLSPLHHGMAGRPGCPHPSSLRILSETSASVPSSLHGCHLVCSSSVSSWPAVSVGRVPAEMAAALKWLIWLMMTQLKDPTTILFTRTHR